MIHVDHLHLGNFIAFHLMDAVFRFSAGDFVQSTSIEDAVGVSETV